VQFSTCRSCGCRQREIDGNPASIGDLTQAVRDAGGKEAKACLVPVRPGALQFGDLSIDVEGREVRRAGAVVTLDRVELRLLAFLASRPNRAYSGPQLVNAVWHSDADASGIALVRHTMRQLRTKLEAQPSQPRWLVSTPDDAYMFCTQRCRRRAA
jgi:two-component system KDP operon response regulator KdpE